MRTRYVTVGLVALASLSGCLSLNIGGGETKRPTMADEITELRKLRDRGTITSREFEMGKLTLLQQYRRDEAQPFADGEQQLATHVEETEPKFTR